MVTYSTSLIIDLFSNLQKFEHMNVMDFSYCEFIIEVPNISGLSTLRKLKLTHCQNLVKVHDSVGFLSNVIELDLAYCKNLKILPRALQMTSLKSLNIQACKSLEHFPEILGNMECLMAIGASNTAIKELPNSFGNLTGYGILYLPY